MQVDETRIGEDLVQQRDAQRVLRRLLQHPHPGCRHGRAALAIAQLGQEALAQLRDDLVIGVAREQAVGIEIAPRRVERRSEEHTSELQSLMRISYAVFCLKKKQRKPHKTPTEQSTSTTTTERNHKREK